MPSQTFYIFTNPEPWRVPPMSVGRGKGGTLRVRSGSDTQLKAYQEEVQDILREQGAYVMEPGYRLNFFFHRTNESETSPTNVRRSRSDATNMQKAIEDALQGVVLENDRDVIDVRSRIIKPDSIVSEPFVIVRVEGEVDGSEPVRDLQDQQWFDVLRFGEELERTRGASSLDNIEEEWTP